MINTAFSIFDRLKIQGNPVANPNSVVAFGSARFTILTSRLIRLEWSPTSQFEDRGTYAFPNRYTQPPRFTYAIDDNQIEIKTDCLTLHYINDGTQFSPKNLSIEFDLNEQLVKWVPGMQNPGNLRGTRRTLDLCTGGTTLRDGLLSRDGWAVIDDSASPVWDSHQLWVEPRPDEHVCDWYFFGYGHDYKVALHDYIRFGGDIPLIPRYVLGAWWSRYWAYHADDLKQLVRDFESYDVPLDVLVVDMDWHTPDGWTGYTWNRDLFPDPPAFLTWAHDQGLQITLNLHPADGVQCYEDCYPQFAERLGYDPMLRDGIKFTPTDKAFIQHYFEVLHHPLEDQGVDFWWLDWQQGEATDIKNLDPLAWLNHLHFHDSTRRGTRPMLYSRWGGLGNHRYPIGFSGDTFATWDALHFQPYFTATAANVAYGWWSHDIGGHLGATDPELYARWVQFGAVSPCLRLHSSKDPLAERRPWAFPTEVYEAAKAAIQFRYRLLPYLYSTAHSQSKQGLSLCTPMYYEYPEYEDAYHAYGQYFLGDQMIAAPIVVPADPQTGLAPVDVWIPEGEWIEFTTLETFCGPRWIRLYGDLNRIPLFARTGAIIPMSPPIMRTQNFDGSHIVLQIFPGADGQFELYEDDGTTDAYRQGAYQNTLICSSISDERTLTISISPAQGDCPVLPAQRTFDLHVKGISYPAQVTVNDVAQSNWRYDPTACELTITVNHVSRDSALEVHVKVAESLSVLPAETQSISPFIHFIDYETYDDARHQLGTAIIVPPADNSPFDVELEWILQRGAVTTTIPITLKQCNLRQIIHSPFADNGSLSAFRWSVSARIAWQGQSLEFGYQSKDAYPSINRWNTLLYNREQQPLSIEDVSDPALAWQAYTQSVEAMRNIKLPFGIMFLEDERQRISSGEPLEACLTTTLVSQSHQAVILRVDCIGTQCCYLNGIELSPTAPIQHTQLDPILYVPVAPTQTYFHLPLQAGANQLVIFTRPTAALGWWGIGATIFEQSGKVFTQVSESPFTIKGGD